MQKMTKKQDKIYKEFLQKTDTLKPVDSELVDSPSICPFSEIKERSTKQLKARLSKFN